MNNYAPNQALSAGGIILGLSVMDISLILGIIYTAINLCVLIFTIIRNIKKRLEDGKITNEERAETAREILELTETIKELEKQTKQIKDKTDE